MGQYESRTQTLSKENQGANEWKVADSGVKELMEKESKSGIILIF